MDEHHTNNQNRNYGPNRHRGNRYRGGEGGGGGGGYRHGSHSPRNRAQRPLLTAATNGLGFAFLGLVFLQSTAPGAAEVKNPLVYNLLVYAVCAFAVSAVVSYVSQRIKPEIFEKISDVFFLVGLVLSVVTALMLGKLI